MNQRLFALSFHANRVVVAGTAAAWTACTTAGPDVAAATVVAAASNRVIRRRLPPSRADLPSLAACEALVGRPLGRCSAAFTAVAPSSCCSHRSCSGLPTTHVDDEPCGHFPVARTTLCRCRPPSLLHPPTPPPTPAPANTGRTAFLTASAQLRFERSRPPRLLPGPLFVLWTWGVDPLCSFCAP